MPEWMEPRSGCQFVPDGPFWWFQRDTEKDKENSLKGFNCDNLPPRCNTAAQSKTSADISLVIFARLQSVFGRKQGCGFHTQVAKPATAELGFHSAVLFSRQSFPRHDKRKVSHGS